MSVIIHYYFFYIPAHVDLGIYVVEDKLDSNFKSSVSQLSSQTCATISGMSSIMLYMFVWIHSVIHNTTYSIDSQSKR